MSGYVVGEIGGREIIRSDTRYHLYKNDSIKAKPKTYLYDLHISARKWGKAKNAGIRGANKRPGGKYTPLERIINNRKSDPWWANPHNQFMFEYSKGFHIGESHASYCRLVGLDPRYHDRFCYLGKKLGCYGGDQNG